MSHTSKLMMVLAFGGAACGSTTESGNDGGGGGSALEYTEYACQHGVVGASGGDDAVAERVTGDNGVFADQCVSATTLLQASCASSTACSAGWLCEPLQTGEVVQSEVTCPTSCKDGRCVTECPLEGDTFEFGGMEEGKWVWTVPGTSKKLVCADTVSGVCESPAQGTKVVVNHDGDGYCNLGEGHISVKLGQFDCFYGDCGWAG